MYHLVRLALLVFLCACRVPMDGAEVVDAAVADAAVDAGPPPCQPTGGGPYWLEEGQLLTVTVHCTGAAAPLRVGPLPDGAIFDEITGLLTWTPTLSLAGVYVLTVTVPSTGEKAGIKIGVADKFDEPGNMPVDPATYTEEYGLPVFHLEVDRAITDLDYTPATIRYRGHVYTAEAKYRGASSLGYPKKSFTLKFDKADKFNEPNFPPGGFRKKRKVTLTTTFDDNSYVRQRLSFQVWNQLDPAHIQVQNYSAVVFLNGQYHGLYAVTDHVDGYLMEDHGLLQDGNLYKAITHDANYKLVRHTSGLPKALLSEGYEKQEGLPLPGEPGAGRWPTSGSGSSAAGPGSARSTRPPARLIGARPMAQDEGDMKSTSQLAQEFILDLSRGDFPRAFASFDSDMQAAVPLVALRNTWRAAQTKLGRLLRHDRMEELERAGYRVCVVHCEFERGTYALRLWFNGERIAGMAMEDPLAGPAGTP